MTISRVKLQELLKNIDDSSIFSVKFLKRSDGTERTMVCRKGVKSHLKGGESAYNPAQKDLLFVFDMLKGEYRSINLLTVFEAKISGAVYKVKK